MGSLPLDHPRIRPVEVFPFEEKGTRTFLVQDPAGYLEAPLQLSPAALLIVSLCDGTRTRESVRAEFESRSGHSLTAAELGEFLATMDRVHLLDSPAFAVHRSQLEREFAAREWRTATHAGAAYDGDPGVLAATLDRWLATGVAGGRARGRLRALVAPHIDFHRGGPGYGKAYAALLEREAPDVVVVLGTGHAADGGRFILCDKGFETACGRLPVDREFLGRLERRLGRDYRRGLLAHRNEHSIEFQAVWLAHLFQATRPAIVPILCTTFDDLMGDSAGPMQLAETADFLGALRETWLEEKRRVLVIAGADLSHVGPRFGDGQRTDSTFLEQVRARDLAALEGAKSGSAERFFAAVAEYKNCHRICSVAGIFTALYTVRADGGDVLVYDQAVDPSGQLAVTFAGIALYGDADGPGIARTGSARRTLRQGRGSADEKPKRPRADSPAPNGNGGTNGDVRPHA
jgi:AmmeMemoRadiSam system protein B